MTTVIEAEGLTKRFGDTQALAGVDLSAEQGTVLGVLGPNGAGKTTAVRILSTLLRPDSGTARIGGYDVLTQAPRVRPTIGLTGQYVSVDQDLTGTQNLVLIGQLLNLSSRDAKARARELLDWFDLSEAAGRMAKNYSGGMRRRLDLAASLVAEGSTVLLTTQYLDEADALADDIVVIDRGEVIAHDTPDGLKRVVGGQRVKVMPADATRLPDVASILRDVGGAEPTVSGRNQLTVPVDGEQALTATLQRLGQDGIPVLEASLHLPSLDEVFMTLTGHTTTDEEDAA
jgi:oleandomycin transport system ATP-binding protein